MDESAGRGAPSSTRGGSYVVVSCEAFDRNFLLLPPKDLRPLRRLLLHRRLDLAFFRNLLSKLLVLFSLFLSRLSGRSPRWEGGRRPRIHGYLGSSAPNMRL